MADGSQFPSTGSVRLSDGLANAETVVYTAKPSANVLTTAALTETHGNGATVSIECRSNMVYWAKLFLNA